MFRNGDLKVGGWVAINVAQCKLYPVRYPKNTLRHRPSPSSRHSEHCAAPRTATASPDAATQVHGPTPGALGWRRRPTRLAARSFGEMERGKKHALRERPQDCGSLKIGGQPRTDGATASGARHGRAGANTGLEPRGTERRSYSHPRRPLLLDTAKTGLHLPATFRHLRIH